MSFIDKATLFNQNGYVVEKNLSYRFCLISPSKLNGFLRNLTGKGKRILKVINKGLADIIRANTYRIRNWLGLSREALAKKSKLGRNTILRIENETGDTTVATLERLAKGFRIPPEVLLLKKYTLIMESDNVKLIRNKDN